MAQPIRVGSTIRFLNATGGGKVTAFQSKDICIVEEEDGFETPVLISDVVVVEPTNEYNFVIEKPKDASNEAQSHGAHTQPSVEENYQFDEADETPEGEQLSVYLAFVPLDIKRLQTTDLELYLVNTSNYYLDYAISQGLERVVMVQHGTIEPQTKLLLDIVKKDQLNEWEVVHIQALPYKRKAFAVQKTVDITLKINTTKFFKLHAFKENDFFDDNALLFTVLRDGRPDVEPTFTADTFRQAMEEKRPQPQKVFKKPQKLQIVEIDLHIGALLDNTNNMTNSEMLNYQLDKFRNVMNQYVGRKGQRIVFIHGKGEGVLRKALLDDLKRRYPKCHAQDASFQQYGFGATMVIVG